jgi:putative membrane protein
MFHTWFWNAMPFGWVFWIAIIALIIWAIVNQGNKNRQINIPPPFHESPMDILKKRYARGEITKDQFELMKKDIE